MAAGPELPELDPRRSAAATARALRPTPEHGPETVRSRGPGGEEHQR